MNKNLIIQLNQILNNVMNMGNMLNCAAKFRIKSNDLNEKYIAIYSICENLHHIITF